MTTTEKKVDVVDEKAEEEKKVDLSPEEEAARAFAKELRRIEAKRRLFRRTLIQYDRIKKRFATQLEKLAAGTPEDKPENPEKDTVVAVYRLVRNFCISYNTLDMVDRTEDKQVFPARYAAELKGALGSQAVVDAFAKALLAEKAEDSAAVLPAKVEPAVVKKVQAFLEQHDKPEITDKLEKELDAMSSDIDKRREELKAKRQELAKTRPKSAEPRATSKSATKKPKKAAKKQDDDSGKATEDRFRDLIAEVNLKVSKIQLTKDDHKTYSDVQTEIDSFLSEAISDILGIKANLKKRWEAVQSGKKRSGASNGRRNRSRQPRPRTRKDSSTEKPADGGQQSVFSKAQQV